MSDFLKKYKPMITRLVITITSASILVGAGVYMILSKKQTYTASTNIKFISSSTEDGYAYDGTLIKDCIDDITGTEVLDKAIQDTGLNITANKLAKQLTVESVIPQEEQNKINSALDNGKEYTYNPIEYKISINTDMPEAGKLLNAIAKEYIVYYTENHVAIESYPATVSTSINDDYDYIESADILRKNVESMETWLTTQSESDSDYHNSTNGYSFSDLYAKYEQIYNNDLPKLYATILTNKASKNTDLLLQTLKQNIEIYSSTNTDTSDDLSNIENMIQSYSEKNKANGSVQNGTTGDEYDENHTNIIENVYENESNPKSTYDELFSKYLTEADEISFNKTDISYNKYLISIFSEKTTNTESSINTDIESQISEILTRLNELHDLATELRTEHAEILSTSVIQQLDTPMSQKTLSVKLYALLAMMACWIGLAVAIPVCMIFKKNIEVFLKSKNF